MRKLIPSHARFTRFAPAVAFATAALSSTAAAQTDFTVTGVHVTQAIQSGSTPLTAGRTTYVRVQWAAAGVQAPADGILRVLVDGVEAPNSPVFSVNGPLAPVAGSPLGQLNGTLNFVYLPPASNDVVFEVEINPAGPNFVPELDTGNNVFSSAQLNFQVRDTPEMAYSPIDYQFGAVPNPNLPDPALIEPGVGDNFVQGIYPSADMFYHRTDAPSKVWTSSLSGSGSALITSLQADRLLMVPVPDYLYGWVPGGLPYNGQSTIGGPASMGNTQDIRHQRTYAHEIGHNTGLFHVTTLTQTPGVDVEHHLDITEKLPQLKVAGLNDVMVPGLLTPDAWIGQSNYNFFFNHPSFDPATDESSMTSAPMLIVAGLWNKDTGEIELHEVVTVEAGGELSKPVPVGEANLFIKAYSGGNLVTELPLRIFSSLEEGGCSGASDTPVGARIVSMVASLPAGAGIDQLEIIDPAHPQPKSLDLRRSAGKPHVAFTAPTGTVDDGVLTVAWEGSDPDGDALRYYLRYSSDGVRRAPLLSGTTATSFEVNLRELPGFKQGVGFFEILASDGLNTTRAESIPLTASASYAGGVGNDPWIEIMSPDNGDRQKRGSTIILHSSGWDLEDRALTGSSIQWSSNVDGPLGSGRLLGVTTLSPGPHTLTVTATDSDGNTTSDTAFMVVTPRALPFAPTCQASLGFGGPGTGILTMCGGDFSTGTTATLQVTNAPPNTLGVLLGGTNFNPQPLLGGTVVPTPAAISVSIGTNASGGFQISGVDGGGGPATLYLQYLYFDPVQTEMVSLTNALEVNVLP